MYNLVNEPYNVFPNHPYQTLHNITIILVIPCFLAAAVWHAQKDPKARTLLATGRINSRIGKVFFLYLIPAFLSIYSIIFAITEDGNPWIILPVAVLYEIALNVYLLSSRGYSSINSIDHTDSVNNQETISASGDKSDNLFRLGRRLLFVSLGVLCGAAFASNQYDDIDYYGPVRVTDLKLIADRPKQEVNKYNPTYYYYYTLDETLEWGGGWGCPASSVKESTWCKYSHSLDNDDYGPSSSDCKKRIECTGNPQADGLGECADSAQQMEAFTFLIGCALNTMSGSLPSFVPDTDSSTIYMNHTIAPWLDSTATWRTAAVNCGDCNIIANSLRPPDLARLALVAWLVGFLMIVAAVTLLFYGTRDVQQRFGSGSLGVQLNIIT